MPIVGTSSAVLPISNRPGNSRLPNVPAIPRIPLPAVRAPLSIQIFRIRCHSPPPKPMLIGLVLGARNAWDDYLAQHRNGQWYWRLLCEREWKVLPASAGDWHFRKLRPQHLPRYGFHNLDFSVSKSWRFYEKLTMQFRAEMFNITNHPNFANPFGGATGQGVGATADPSVGPVRLRLRYPRHRFRQPGARLRRRSRHPVRIEVSLLSSPSRSELSGGRTRSGPFFIRNAFHHASQGKINFSERINSRCALGQAVISISSMALRGSEL